MNKIYESCEQALADVFDGATIMIGGFGEAGIPAQLAEHLRSRKLRNLTIINNGAGNDDYALGGLIKDGCVSKLIATFPNYPSAWAFQELYSENKIELEIVPQGTFVERIRAGGAGIGGFYTRTGVGTELAKGKEVRIIDGKEYVLEKPLYADFAFIKAHKGDRYGNLIYRRAMRNFNTAMATAADVVIAEVDEVVTTGALNPEEIHSPGIFVDRVVQVERHPRLFQSTNSNLKGAVSK